MAELETYHTSLSPATALDLPWRQTRWLPTEADSSIHACQIQQLHHRPGQNTISPRLSHFHQPRSLTITSQCLAFGQDPASALQSHLVHMLSPLLHCCAF